MPNNCVFLVDTYDTLQGVKNAIEVGNWLRGEGHEMVGVRLDSGDLAWLSIEARRLLDEAGFEKAAIVASNDLDEKIITSLKDQGARIGVWGVGTKLATAYDQPALGGVYKLSAIREAGGEWQYKVKLSEQAVKVSNPGRLQVRRYLDERGAAADAIYDQGTAVQDGCTIVDPMDPTRRRKIPAGATGQDLLIPLFREGKRVHDPASIATARERAAGQLELFHGGVKRFTNPHKYPVGLEKTLFERKQQLILKARGLAP
jgi:nicotinate phosphoribosyltransferase